MKNKMNFIMLLAVLFWSGAFIAGKYTANVIDTVTITFLRFLIASVILDIYIVSRKTEWNLNRKMLVHSSILALVGMIGYHIFFYKALETTSAIHASLIASTNPFFTYILSIVFLKTKPKLKKFVFIFIALFSVSLIVIDWDFSNLLNGGVNPGDIVMFLAVFLWASYSILVKRFIVNYNPMILTTVVFNITALMLIPFVNFSQVMNLFNNDLTVVLSIFYMGIFPTIFGYMIQQFSIKSIGPEKTNIYINLVPVFTVVLSVVILGEIMNIMNLLTGLLVIGSVYKFNTTE